MKPALPPGPSIWREPAAKSSAAPEALLADHVVDQEGRTHDVMILSYDIGGFNG